MQQGRERQEQKKPRRQRLLRKQERLNKSQRSRRKLERSKEEKKRANLEKNRKKTRLMLKSIQSGQRRRQRQKLLMASSTVFDQIRANVPPLLGDRRMSKMRQNIWQGRKKRKRGGGEVKKRQRKRRGGGEDKKRKGKRG